MDQGFDPIPPVAKSKTPPRPLREALRIRMGRSGWECGFLFGQPLPSGPISISISPTPTPTPIISRSASAAICGLDPCKSDWIFRKSGSRVIGIGLTGSARDAVLIDRSRVFYCKGKGIGFGFQKYHHVACRVAGIEGRASWLSRVRITTEGVRGSVRTVRCASRLLMRPIVVGVWRGHRLWCFYCH